MKSAVKTALVLGSTVIGTVCVGIGISKIPPRKYSLKWANELSDIDLEKEMQNAQNIILNPENDEKTRAFFQMET